MISITTATQSFELQEILEVQKANHASGLTNEERLSQGYVTVTHSFDQLDKMNRLEQHVIAKDDQRVVAYVLAMTKESRTDIPILFSLFDSFDQLYYNGKLIAACNYLVSGQVCVAKEYRGMQLADACYAKYNQLYSRKYEFVVTEIAAENTRSLQVHFRIGFKELYRYNKSNGAGWVVVIWNWN